MKAALSLRAKSGAWVVGTGSEGQWMATGLRPRDDTGEVWGVVFVIARRERSD